MKPSFGEGISGEEPSFGEGIPDEEPSFGEGIPRYEAFFLRSKKQRVMRYPEPPSEKCGIPSYSFAMKGYL
jgi:hypothetical protein